MCALPDKISRLCLQHLALLHAAQPGAELVPKSAAIDEQTIKAYVVDRIWARTASNKRFRKFLAGSSLFASTTAGARPGLVEWYYSQTDSLLEQPSSFLTEDSETLQWMAKDAEWAEIHRNYSMQMANSQVCFHENSTWITAKSTYKLHHSLRNLFACMWLEMLCICTCELRSTHCFTSQVQR